MSYPYKVVVTKGVEESVQAADRSERRVEIPQILDKETTREILKKALKDRGWTGDCTVLVKDTEDGLTQIFDLEEGTVVTTIEEGSTIRKELTLEGHGDSWSKPTAADEAALRQAVEEKIQARLKISEEERQRKQAELEASLARKIEESEEARTASLNEALLEVYSESLKRKAKSLGTVTETREESCPETGEYELVIRVEE